MQALELYRHDRYESRVDKRQRRAQVQRLPNPDDASPPGRSVAKMLIIDARLRNGKPEAARDLLLTIRDPVPPHLQYPYGAAAALVALSLHDSGIRHQALEALNRLPPAFLESDKNVQSYLVALHGEMWDKPAD